MNISARDRALLAVVVGLAVLAAIYVLVLGPQYTRAGQLQKSVLAARQKLSVAQQQYATGRAAQRRLSATTADYAAAHRAVPGQSNIPALLRLLQRTADAANVSIDSISLSGSGSGTTSTPSPAATPGAATTSTGGGAQTVPVSLTFGGGYQALNRMVQRLDTFVLVSHGHLRAAGPLVGISSVDLTPQSNSGASRLSVTLSATIYQHAAAASVNGATSGGTS